MLSSLIKMLHNTKENKYHPIFFYESPLPGNANLESGIIRYKSKGHHAEGFTNRDDALKEIDKIKPELANLIIDVENDIEWDGKDVPAMVEFVAK